VASTAIDTLTDQRVPRFATGVVVPIAVFVTVLHCAASTLGDDHWFDEVYMLAIGRLDWGSADQPPLAPALAALMDWLAPGSQFVRALPAARRPAARSCWRG
jgi:predicted membrane-bound dolichyl-phosphate-mannose-protein mannosyltransferase